MKKMLIDCTKKTQEYVELTKAEVKLMRKRHENYVPEPESESLDDRIRRIVKEELKK